MSSISIIGVGNVASPLVNRSLTGGDAVEFIGRDPSRAEALAAAVGDVTGGAAPAGDIVVPYAGSIDGRLVDVFIASDDAQAM